eukprot:TRINITY_DN1910_c0_g1_i1.p1 TRINITY_DN1910_c0_g1~~TRINITY_DN1910_c0_g1_i1.p1  ORF type:complete len:231 (+),score=36.10 TRINITY_DN1910_c0_g1_i1:68-760(+)
MTHHLTNCQLATSCQSACETTNTTAAPYVFAVPLSICHASRVLCCGETGPLVLWVVVCVSLQCALFVSVHAVTTAGSAVRGAPRPVASACCFSVSIWQRRRTLPLSVFVALPRPSSFSTWSVRLLCPLAASFLPLASDRLLFPCPFRVSVATRRLGSSRSFFPPLITCRIRASGVRHDLCFPRRFTSPTQFWSSVRRRGGVPPRQHGAAFRVSARSLASVLVQVPTANGG